MTLDYFTIDETKITPEQRLGSTILATYHRYDDVTAATLWGFMGMGTRIDYEALAPAFERYIRDKTEETQATQKRDKE